VHLTALEAAWWCVRCTLDSIESSLVVRVLYIWQHWKQLKWCMRCTCNRSYLGVLWILCMQSCCLLLSVLYTYRVLCTLCVQCQGMQCILKWAWSCLAHVVV
jgi:hypothetical protein